MKTGSDMRQVIVPVLLFWAIILPPGLALELGTVVIPPFRMAILLLLPFIIDQWVRARPRMIPTDWLVIFGALFGACAMLVTERGADGIEAGGSFAIDVLGSYLIGRLYIDSVGKFQAFLKLIVVPAFIVGAIAVFESVSGQLLIAPLFPTRASMELLFETRLGFLRARTTFPHSIAAGMFLASFLPIYFYSGLPRWQTGLGVLTGAAAVFTVSSSALLALAVTVVLISYKTFYNVLLGARERMLYLVGAFVLLWIALDLFTQSGAIRFFIRNFTLTPQSGYYRLLIWEYGTRAVADFPLFGIGNAPMPRARWMVMETIDNHWLLLAVRYGLATSAALVLATIMALAKLGSVSSRANHGDRAKAMGLCFALAAFFLIAWTAALWANTQSWYFLLLGIAVGLAGALGARQAQASQPSPISVRPGWALESKPGKA